MVRGLTTVDVLLSTGILLLMVFGFVANYVLTKKGGRK